jgi:hypothetical protein
LQSRCRGTWSVARDRGRLRYKAILWVTLMIPLFFVFRVAR